MSHKKTNTLLQALRKIIFTLYQPLEKVYQSTPEHPSPPTLDIPIDVRTLYARTDIEPKIIRTICCPKCFKLYPSGLNEQTGELNQVPKHCTWRAGPGTRKDCGQALFRSAQNRSGGVKKIPISRFSVQDFESWLHCLLNRPGIEALIEKSYDAPLHQPGEIVNNLWNTRSWHEGLEDGFSLKKGNLTFGLYVDWFNPFTNKLAGEISYSDGQRPWLCSHYHRPQSFCRSHSHVLHESAP